MDPDLLDNKSGIGRDAKIMLTWLNKNFQTQLIDWPRFFPNQSKLRRKVLIGLRILLGCNVTLPKSFGGAFYQAQLGPVLPGKSSKIWIVRLHDLFPITNPEWFNWWSRYVFRNSFYKALESKAVFICDSNTTQEVLIKNSAGHAVKSYVVPCEVLPSISKPCGGCKACKDLEFFPTRKFYLAVGTIEPRKNYSLALDIWFSLPVDGPMLVIVGRPGWKTMKVQRSLRSGLSSGILWLPDCCDGALEILYSKCEALISFSFAEGFDLPPMEARQRHSKPLILSDIPVHREFHSDEASFFSNTAEFLELLKDPLRPSSFSGYAKDTNFALGLLEDYLNSVL